MQIDAWHCGHEAGHLVGTVGEACTELVVGVVVGGDGEGVVLLQFPVACFLRV